MMGTTLPSSMLLLLCCPILVTFFLVDNATAFVVLPKPPAGVVFGTSSNSGRIIGNTLVASRLNLALNSSGGNKEGEEILRDRIAQKNAQLDPKNEAQYAVVEGSDIAVVEEGEDNEDNDAAVDTVDVSSRKEPSKTKETEFDLKMKRITKPRPYPLFLLEKAANVVDDLLEDVAKVAQNSDVEFGSFLSSSSSSSTNGNVSKNDNDKEKIVVLGTGWGAAAFLQGIDASKFDVTVISPRNFFLFTPMLAGASVGTVEYRSITEPVREINTEATYLEATATMIRTSDSDSKDRVVECESVVCDGNSCTIQDFQVAYDRLVVTVGAQTNTFGIPGVRDYCCFLKSVEDARRIRTALVNCFERANLPNVSTDEQRRNILTFCVIGAGPTGIEFASELRDFVEQDGPKYYPRLLRHVRIKVIEASSAVLAPFAKSLQNAAVDQLTRVSSVVDNQDGADLVELLLDSGVNEVREDVISLNNGHEVPYGLSVWAAGNGPLPITLQLIESLHAGQEPHQATTRGRLAVDPWLRAYGSPGGRVLALGDCSCNPDGPLPATAQVASQQGEYLARVFNSCDMSVMSSSSSSSSSSGTSTDDVRLLPPKYKTIDSATATTTTKQLADYVTGFAMNDYEYAAPFQFLNLGILAYTGGGSALAQLQVIPGQQGSVVKGKGKIGFGLWRSVYLTKQVSWRNRFLVLTDWVKAQVFGRDITRA